MIDEVWKKYGRMGKYQIRDLTHTLPEWHDPQGSNSPIRIEDILRAEGFSSDDVADVIEGLRAEEFASQLGACSELQSPTLTRRSCSKLATIRSYGTRHACISRLRSDSPSLRSRRP